MNASTTATSTRSSRPPAGRPSRRRALALAAGLAGMGLVAACGGGPPRADRGRPEPPPPERGQVEVPPPAALPQFALDVAEIRIVPAYAPPPGGADHGVPFAPKEALETWAKTHVQARGRRWQAWIVIRDASITARPLRPKTDTWRDWFRRQPVERYDAVLALELEIRDDAGAVRAQTIARATHARFLMDDYRDYQRERSAQLQRLTDEVIAAALKRLEAEVRTNLARWVR